jgi:concanavalin A-like lectin/glucanase superfamily protein
MALTDSLISWWELGEASGTRADSHGTNHLTDNNTVLSAVGKVGNAADIERDNVEYLSCASNSTLQMGDIDFTICCWVKVEQTDGLLVQLVSKDNSNSPAENDFNLTCDPTFRFFTNWAHIPNSGITPTLGVWYFVVGWHDAVANTHNIQVDNATPVSVSTAGDAPVVSTSEFQIGARQWAASRQSFDGLIDQVAIWKRLLTTDERTALYNSGNGVAYADLASHHRRGSSARGRAMKRGRN